MSFPYPLTVKVFKDPQNKEVPYVAYIPEFDLSSCGKSEKQAVENVKEALNLVIEEVKKRGMLKEYLEELGIKYEEKSLELPKVFTLKLNLAI